MKKQITLVALLAVGLLSLPSLQLYSGSTLEKVDQNKVITIEGVNINRTIETNGNETIKIDGTNNNITIIGNCAKIDIEGTNNHVTAKLVGAIAIEGANNAVFYSGSPTKSKTTTRTEGVNNVIKIKK